MKNINNINTSIDNIIARRKEQLPIINREKKRVQKERDKLQMLNGKLSSLYTHKPSEEVLEQVKSAQKALNKNISKFNGYLSSLKELEQEFLRNTLNIGVSGAARVGKSTTLQGITGLSDLQIPSGEGLPVTAVRSEIYNSATEKAEVFFKTEQEFIEGYVRPHVENINECLAKEEQIAIDSVAALKTAKLPSTLGENVKAASTDSLVRLGEAQKSVDRFSPVLGRPFATVTLKEIKQYISYPDVEEISTENDGATVCNRFHLAVDHVKIYCPFPNLGEAKVALVDLPGLGEIDNSAEEIHLNGLESMVDQIFLVMRPRKESSYVDDSISHNLNELSKIQPAVRRGDLIVAGFNRGEDIAQESVDTMKKDFSKRINASREDQYTIEEYCATSSDDVEEMFIRLLEHMANVLPYMDEAKIDHCMGGLDLSVQVADIANNIVGAMDDVLKDIPSTDMVRLARINKISRDVVGEINRFADELQSASSEKSEEYEEYLAKVNSIHKSVEKHIEGDLFCTSGESWEERTRGAYDYYNLYRDEDKRLRFEIIEAYSGLNVFFEKHLASFKQRLLNIVIEAFGLKDLPAFASCQSVNLNRPDCLKQANNNIAKVSRELHATLHYNGLEKAFRLLENASFEFLSNVFFNIEEHVDNLANPDSESNDGKYRVFVLGEAGNLAEKQENLLDYIQSDANASNNAIKTTLTSEKDFFNQYLYICIDFFRNHLYEKDMEAFKHIVLSGLIREYKEYVLPDADDASKSPLGKVVKEVKKCAQALANGNDISVKNGGFNYANSRGSKRGIRGAKKTSAQGRQNSTRTASRPGQNSSNNVYRRNNTAAKVRPTARGFRVGDEYFGKVKGVCDSCVLVTVNGEQGFVPKSEIANCSVANPADYVEKGVSVYVKVIKDFKNQGRLVLSMKRASMGERNAS